MKKVSRIPWLEGEKAKPTRRLVELKEEFLKLAPGFTEAGEQFLAAVAELRNAGKTGEANRLGQKFAAEWNIPYENDERIDPSYLVRTPFSANPAIEIHVNPVQHLGTLQPPFVEIIIDTRFDLDLILDEIKTVVSRTRAFEGKRNRATYRRWDREVGKLEQWLAVHRLAESGLKTREIVGRLQLAKDQSVVSRQRSQAAKFVEERQYQEILPFLNGDAVQDLRLVSAPHPLSRHRRGPYTAVVQARGRKPRRKK